MLAELKFTIIISNWCANIRKVSPIWQHTSLWITDHVLLQSQNVIAHCHFSIQAYQMSFWLWAWKLPEFWSEYIHCFASKFEHWTSPWNVWWIGKTRSHTESVDERVKMFKTPLIKVLECFQVNISTLNCLRVFLSIFHHLFPLHFLLRLRSISIQFFIRFVRQCSSSHRTLILEKKVEVACFFPLNFNKSRECGTIESTKAGNAVKLFSRASKFSSSSPHKSFDKLVHSLANKKKRRVCLRAMMSTKKLTITEAGESFRWQ